MTGFFYRPWWCDSSSVVVVGVEGGDMEVFDDGRGWSQDKLQRLKALALKGE